jgi:nicotinate-nucleotide adenylyltransferase
MSKAKEVLVFGGSFNPPHLGHREMAVKVLEANLVDEVWFMPVSLHSFGKEIVSSAHRLRMCELLLEDIVSAYPEFKTRLKVEALEVKNGGISYTASSMEELASIYSEKKFSFLLGSDNLKDFNQWGDRQERDYLYFLSKFEIYVYPRENFSFEPIYSGMIPLKDFSAPDISSTQVRAAIKSDTSVEDLLTASVYAYIKKESLYGKS